MAWTVKNWKKFQHYRDRKPSWIKLYRDLLDDIEWHRISGEAAKALINCWLIGSEKDGELPSVKELSFRLRISEEQANQAVEELFNSGFIQKSDELFKLEDGLTVSQQIAKNNGFGTRYIPDEIKRQVLIRDKGICVRCQSSKKIEFDHIQPVSKGGQSVIENIQILCRPCNRKKRTSTVAAPSVADSCDKRSLEKSREEIEKRERKEECIGANDAPPPVGRGRAKFDVVKPTEGLPVKKSPHVDFVDGFKATYEAMSGQPYKYDQSQFVIAKSLLDKYGNDVVVEKVRILGILCRDRSTWFTKSGWGDFSIKTLSNKWNSIIPQAAVSEQQTLLEDIKKQEELRERANDVIGR